MAGFNVHSGENTGTGGDDTFYVNSNVGDFSIDGNGGRNTLVADVRYVTDVHWNTDHIDAMVFFRSFRNNVRY